MENILTNPPELFEIIARYAHPQVLLALRLVCRESKAKVESIFTEVHFSSFAVLAHHEQSLKTLLAVSEHPRFSRTVKKVLFCTDYVADASRVRNVSLSSSPSASPKPEPEPSPAELELARCRKKAVADQRRLWRKYTDLKLLTQIFSNFADVGNIVDVGITAMHEDIGCCAPPLRP